jgi:microcystin-dependent protein
MAEPFLGEVKIFSFSFPPRGWALCNGQQLSISQNQALFSLLGTAYGGNGITTFQLPNLQGGVPFHVGNGFLLGQAGGEVNHTLSQFELPAHSHVVTASGNAADQVDPANHYWAKGIASAYADAGAINNTMAAAAITAIGGSQAHNNMSPYLVLSFCIALQGIFPSRS